MRITLTESLDQAIELGDELIVYSEKSGNYVGVGGAGRLLLQALGELGEAVPSEILFAHIIQGVIAGASGRAMLKDALQALVEEGLCIEQF